MLSVTHGFNERLDFLAGNFILYSLGYTHPLADYFPGEYALQPFSKFFVHILYDVIGYWA